MGGPFRYNKKERKRLRRFAKKAAIAADKFETEGIKPNAVAVLRRLAESNVAIAKGRKKKKSKNSN
jgi:hypothetical protein